MKKKIIKAGLVVFISLLAIHYLPFNFQYKFNTNHSPYSILTEIQNVGYVLEQNGNLYFNQQFKNKNYAQISWELIAENQKTKVKSRFKYTKNNLLNNLKFWFRINNDFELFKNINYDTKKRLDRLNSLINYGSISNDSYIIKNCICKSFNSSIKDKANLMNKNIDVLAKYVPAKKKSAPFVRIKKLNFINDSLSFDFCFNIPDKYKPEIKENDIFIKQFEENYHTSKTFTGNYNYSYHNWSILLFEKKSNLYFPIIETYLDNPFNGSDDKKWISKVFFNTK